MKLLIPIDPKTKKNSQQIITVNGRHIIVPSSAYKKYEKQAIQYMPTIEPIKNPVNVKCVYYMQTRRRVDLVNLIECTMDVLVKGGVLEDDNSQIAVSHDGSRVYYDKENPRTEIEITEVEEWNKRA